MNSCWEQCQSCGNRCQAFASQQSQWADSGLNIPQVVCNFTCGTTTALPGGTSPDVYGSSGFLSYERYAWRSCYIETPAAAKDMCSLFINYASGQAPSTDQCSYIKRFFSFPSVSFIF